jgi:hypothetical protein
MLKMLDPDPYQMNGYKTLNTIYTVPVYNKKIRQDSKKRAAKRENNNSAMMLRTGEYK